MPLARFNKSRYRSWIRRSSAPFSGVALSSFVTFFAQWEEAMFSGFCGPRSWCCKLAAFAAACFCLMAALSSWPEGARSVNAGDDASIDQGQQIFRFDTFGDEQVWTDTLRMHEVIESSLDPITALNLGLRVDADALPADFMVGVALGVIDLTDPETTLDLIDAGAVVGIIGTVEEIDGVKR